MSSRKQTIHLFFKCFRDCVDNSLEKKLYIRNEFSLNNILKDGNIRALYKSISDSRRIVFYDIHTMEKLALNFFSVLHKTLKGPYIKYVSMLLASSAHQRQHK